MADEKGMEAENQANTAQLDGEQQPEAPSTPSSSSGMIDPDSEKIAQNPEIQKAFRDTFGSDSDETVTDASATRRRQRQEEEADELSGLDEASEADDGVEPDEEQAEGGDTDEPADKKDDASEAKQGQEGDDDAPTLSPVLRQAAKRAGWTDEEIAELAKRDPELAERTCTKLLKSYNDLSSEYGRLGAAAQQRGDATQAPQQQAPQQPSQPENFLEQIYGQDKATAIAEKYGQDFMDDVIKPLLDPVREMMTEVQSHRQQAVADEVQGWFGDAGDFAELYGADDSLSDTQYQNRQKLAMQADQIRLGASLQGVDLSVRECLDRANLQFAAEHLGEIERKKITRQVKKRSDRMTARPSNRQRSAAPGGGKSEEAAMQAYQQRAAELGVDVG